MKNCFRAKLFLLLLFVCILFCSCGKKSASTDSSNKSVDINTPSTEKGTWDSTPKVLVPSADGKTITVTTDALGDFVLCDLDTAGATSTDAPASDVDQNQGGNDLFLMWLIIGAAVLVAVIVIVIALIVSKKKK